MSTSSNLLDASPTPVSESEFPPEPDRAYTIRTSASTIAPDPVFHQQDTTKEFTITAGNYLVVEDVHLSLPIPQSSQESNPQGQGKEIVCQQHVTSGGPVVDETSPSISSRDSKQEQVTEDIENPSVEVKHYQDKCEDLHQQLKRVKLKCMIIEDQYRSHVTEMEQNVQSLTATNENLVDKLKSLNDNHEKEKEALTIKHNHEMETRFSKFEREVNEEILKRRKVAEDLADLRSFRAIFTWLMHEVFLFLFCVLVFVLDYSDNPDY